MRRRDGKPAANNSSGVTGVCPHNTTNSWRAYLGHNRYRYFLGFFRRLNWRSQLDAEQSGHSAMR